MFYTSQFSVISSNDNKKLTNEKPNENKETTETETSVSVKVFVNCQVSVSLDYRYLDVSTEWDVTEKH